MPPRPSPHNPASAPRTYAIPVCNPCQRKVCQLQTEVSWAGGVGVMVMPCPQSPAPSPGGHPRFPALTFRRCCCRMFFIPESCCYALFAPTLLPLAFSSDREGEGGAGEEAITGKEGCHVPAGWAGEAEGGRGGQGEQGWRKGLPGVEDGCVLSREGGGDGSQQAGEGLSVKRTPAGRWSGTSAPRRGSEEERLPPYSCRECVKSP